MSKTAFQYKEQLEACRNIYMKKSKDYGTAWRILRTISIVDQITIKAQRIRTIQESKVQYVQDDIASEFQGIVNYSIIGLIQLEQKEAMVEEWSIDKALSHYDTYSQQAIQLMEAKNHDYGEAWRYMTQESMVDLILMKLIRMKQIVHNGGKTMISEGIDANYLDMINYSIFALILISEQKINKI